MGTPEPDRATVAGALRAAFPNDWERVIQEMVWTSLDGNWFILYKGMHVGIEPDGYIHT